MADTDVVSMVRYVRDRACDGLTVGGMVKKAGLLSAAVGIDPSCDASMRVVQPATVRNR